MDPRGIVKHILELAGAGNDSERLEKEFYSLCCATAFQRIIDQLPEEKKSAILEKLKEPVTPEVAESVIKNDIGEATYLPMVTKVTEELFEKYLRSLKPKLDKNIRDSIKTYLKTLTVAQAHEASQ